jgi:hypothetical protein
MTNEELQIAILNTQDFINNHISISNGRMSIIDVAKNHLENLYKIQYQKFTLVNIPSSIEAKK